MASRADQTSKEAKEEVKHRPRTNLNGGDLVQSTFLVLTFAFALAFMATFVLALILAFLSPFGGKIHTFFGCNGEKRSILGQGGIVLLEPLAGSLRMPSLTWGEGLPFTGPHFLCEEGEQGRTEQLLEEDGSVSAGPGCMPTGMDVLEEDYDYGQYLVCVGKVVKYCPEGQEWALVVVLEEATCSSVTGKAPCWPPVLSYPRLAPILTPPTFANAASDNFFNLFVCNFWPERFNLFGVAFYYVQFRIMICWL